MIAYIFPGQGAQFPGMGKDIYEGSDKARILFESANQVLGFRITDIMFDGTTEELKQMATEFPALEKNTIRILASIKMLEINISDVVEFQ